MDGLGETLLKAILSLMPHIHTSIDNAMNKGYELGQLRGKIECKCEEAQNVTDEVKKVGDRVTQIHAELLTLHAQRLSCTSPEDPEQLLEKVQQLGPELSATRAKLEFGHRQSARLKAEIEAMRADFDEKKAAMDKEESERAGGDAATKEQ